MSAISAVDVANLHLGLLFVELSHACPLPGVFTGICKKNIFAFDVEASVVRVRDLCMIVWKTVAEDTFAIVRPKGQVDLFRSHRELIVRGLIKSKFSAVLIGPLASGFVSVYFNILERFVIVLVVRDASCSPEIGHSFYLSRDFLLCISCKHVA